MLCLVFFIKQSSRFADLVVVLANVWLKADDLR